MPRFAMLAVLGLASQGLAILLWLAAKSWTGFDIANFWANLVLPVGALSLGFVAGFGFAFARHIDAPAGRSMLMTMLGFSVCGAAFMQFASYWIAESGGLALRETVSFAEYVQLTNANAAMRLGAHESASVIEIGRMGYVYTLAEMVSYVAGSLWPYFTLGAVPFCADCARYLRGTEMLILTFSRLDAFKAYAGSLAADGWARLQAHRSQQHRCRPLPQREGRTTLIASLSTCPGCSERHLSERVLYVGAEGPGRISAFDYEDSWAERDVRQAPLMVNGGNAHAHRGFGRKVVR